MTKNMGRLDRVLRLLLALVLGYLYYNGTIGGALGIVLVVASVIFFLTAIFGVCPLYKIIGVKTCRRTNTNATS
jgi:hypothetical protein